MIIEKNIYCLYSKVSFEIGDVMQHEYNENSFDVVYSRDTILHITDKKTLFARLYVGTYLLNKNWFRICFFLSFSQ